MSGQNGRGTKASSGELLLRDAGRHIAHPTPTIVFWHDQPKEAQVSHELDIFPREGCFLINLRRLGSKLFYGQLLNG